MRSDSGHTYVLTDNELHVYDAQMQPEAVYDTPDASSLELIGDDVYYLTGSSLEKLSHQQQKEEDKPASLPLQTLLNLEVSMNIASILMDLAVVLIVIWQVRRGYHNGLMRMLIECLSWLAAAVLAVMISYAISGTIYDMFFAGRITEAVTNAILEAGSPEAFAGSLEQTLASMPEAIRSAAEFLMGGVDLSAVTSAQAAELAQTVTDSIVRPLITSAIQLVSFLILFALGLMVLHIVAIAFGAFNSIPLVGGINRALGGVFGLVKAAAILFILTLVLQFYFTFGTPSGVVTPAAVQESFLTEIFYDNNPLSHFLNVG